MYLTSHVMKRHWRLIALTIGLIVFFWLVYPLRSAVFPFVLGFVLAYIFLPFILWIEKRLPHKDKWHQTKRISLILLIYLIILALIGSLSFYIFTAIVSSFEAMIRNASQYTSEALLRLQQWVDSILQQSPPEMQNQINQFINQLGNAMGNAVQSIFVNGITLIPTTIGFVLGLAALPFFLFYLLKDWTKLSNGLYSGLPVWWANHTRNVVAIIEGVLGRYIRAQITCGLVVGILVFTGLYILRIPFAPALAVFAGLTELIPTLGPWIGGVTAVIITLAAAPGKIIWVIVVFAAVQLLENTLLVPRIQAAYLRLHPAIVLVLLVMGAYLFGFWGLVLAVPVSATVVELYKYMLRAAKEEDGNHRTLPGQRKD